MVRNVIDYLRESAEKYPDKKAFVDEKRNITFRELDIEARKLAYAIERRFSCTTNHPIAVYIEKSVEAVIAFMGILYSGNFYCPIDVKMPTERLGKIMSVLEPVAMIYNDKMPNVSNGIELLELSVKSDIDDEEVREYEFGWKNILDIDPIYVLFTSGSTGQPKGVVISHKGVIDYSEWLYKTFLFDETTVFGNQAPFYFDNSVMDIYSTLKNGSTMVMIPENLFAFQHLLLEYIASNHINTIFWVPSALISVANSGILEKVFVKELKKILFAGEVMPTKQLNIWRKHYSNALFANLYGPTEITDICTYYIVKREFSDEETLPIGIACENTGILVLNEDNELAKCDEIGEICVRGTGVSMGYYGDAERTAESFVQNPLNHKYKEIIYKTGDLAKYNERHELIYVGRKDYQIKHQGYRIELGEIETIAGAIEGVDKVCVIYDDNNKKIVLFCCIKSEKINEKMIYAVLKSKLPRYMLPGLICIQKELPLNANGKIDRRELKKQLG